MAESAAVRDAFPCNEFVESDKWLIGSHDGSRIDVLCSNCGWGKLTHHNWYRTDYGGSLGPGWQCRTCGRTAYDKHGRCSAESSPIDYPPCWPSWMTSDGDTD